MEKYVGDGHEFKQENLGKKAKIVRFDIFLDTKNGNLFINAKRGRAVDAIETGVNTGGRWVDTEPDRPAAEGGC